MFLLNLKSKYYFVILIFTIIVFYALRAPLPLQWEFFRFIKREDIAGVSVAIKYSDKAAKKFQIGNYSRDGVIDSNTRFPLASLSKPLTAAAIYELKKGNSIRLNDDIIKVMQFSSWDEKSLRGVVTIRNLLQHTGGMSPAGKNDPLFFSWDKSVGCTNVLIPESSRPGWLAGTRTAYSNIGYCLLGEIIKFKTQKEYQDAVMDLLKIPSTSKITVSYHLDDGNTYFGQYHPSFYRAIAPVGGWFSNAEDYVDLLDGLNNSGDSARYLEEANLDFNDSVVVYALGWRVYDKEKKLLTHFGYLNGVFSVAILRVDGGAAVALFSGAPVNPDQAFEEIASLFERSLK